jgi:hypothetical protein
MLYSFSVEASPLVGTVTVFYKFDADEETIWIIAAQAGAVRGE